MRISHENRLLTVCSMDIIKIFHTLGLIVKEKISGILKVKELDLLIKYMNMLHVTARAMTWYYIIYQNVCAKSDRILYLCSGH